MFGLMRPERKCGKSCHDWTRTHRMHYCGTCKAIGTQYGHQARLFLNFDIVFLSELLSDLNDEKMNEWTAAYQSINRCFSMPTEADNTPFSLQYTATANTILSALKVDDNIKDQKQLRWYATRKFYARSFRKAFEQMEAWGTPKEAFFHWIDLQIEREESLPKEQHDLFDYLSFYAEPTAELTALIFKEGIKKINPIHQETFRTLGYNFGLLMYVLDAFEDLEQDIFTQQFNPLIHWFNANKTLEQDQLADVRHIILQLQHKVCEGFKALPLKQATTYSSRLVSNIALRIYRERYIPTTRKERIQFRWERAKEFATQIICAPETNYSVLKYYLVTSSIFLMPRLVHEMPKRADKIDWEWSTFWSMVLPFSANSNTSASSNQNSKEEEEKNKKIACCCCFSSLSIFPISQCCISNSVSTGGTTSCSKQGSSGQCPLKDGSCNCCCDGGNCGACCCDSGIGNRDCRDCCCGSGNSGACCSNGGGNNGGGGNSGGNNGGGGNSGGNDGGGGNSGGSDGGGGNSGGSDGSGENSGGSDGGGDCCSGSGGNGNDCCSGSGGGGGGDCCCDKGGGGGGGDCCCDKGGGGGGGGCCCDKGGGGGGGGGCCDKGGGGGGGGCCCDKGGGGGGGGCCCDKGGGGGGGGCCCDKGGGGGGGGCDCCKADAGGFDLSAPAHFESCNGVLECFFPWHC